MAYSYLQPPWRGLHGPLLVAGGDEGLRAWLLLAACMTYPVPRAVWRALYMHVCTR